MLQSNNPNGFGIVDAKEIAGHRCVMNLSSLYELPDPILSLSGNNTLNDSVGQLWYVANEQSFYQLIEWSFRREARGWRKFEVEDGAVTEEKIADRAITSNKIDSDTVESHHLRYGAVTTPKIDNGSVTKEKLDTELRDALSGYHDDGSGQLVPIKHPDLSTQPSILPYKVGGSYVYEQLICLSEAHCGDDADYTDKVSCEIPWTAEVENPKILSASFFTSCAEYPNANIPVIAHYYGGRIIALVDRIALARAGSLPLEDGTMPTGWLRIEYSEFKDTGSGYYYYE